MVVEPNDQIHINTIIESRDARFDEQRFKTIPKTHDILKEVVSTDIPLQIERENSDDSLDHQVEPRRSTRQRRSRTFGPDFEMYLVKEYRNDLIKEYPIIYNLDNEP